MMYIRIDHTQWKDVESIYDLAKFLARYFPRSENYLTGIHELLVNAVEHGNLGIGHAMKAELFAQGRWKEEMIYRLSLPENRIKTLEIQLEYEDPERVLTITDSGEGFDCVGILQGGVGQGRFNGRGLQIAYNMPNMRVSHNQKGNQVKCSMRIDAV